MRAIDGQKLDKIKELLEAEESFPLRYVFKFIVPTASLSNILSLFPEEKNLSTKPSAKGNYISVTIVRNVDNADEVVQVYKSVSVIDGVLSL
jgi:hypothetical protein